MSAPWSGRRRLGGLRRRTGESAMSRLGPMVYGGIVIAFVLLRLLGVPPWDQSVDAYAYWSTRDGDYYTGAVGRIGAYVYPPIFAQAIAPITWLPWPAFNALWTLMNCLALAALAGRWAALALLVLPIPFEIVSGNIHLLMALAIVVGFRHPAAWAFVLLTKATSGVGLLWFAVRREWRPLVVAGGTAVALAGVSVLLDPAAWRRWLDLVIGGGVASDSPGWWLPVPLPIRLALAAVVVGWGGLTDRRWTVGVAGTIALPVLWLNGLAVGAALLPELRDKRGESRSPQARHAAGG
jgi:hypothetical protein